MKKKFLLCLLVGMMFPIISLAQYVYGTTGLLHMPTAEMQRDKTFLFGASYLDVAATPDHWDYHTFNYYINITFFPWLEIGYTCTLHKAPQGSNYYPPSVWGKYCNQDRQFSGRLRVWKEGWWKSWAPQIVVGANDPGTNDKTSEKDYGIGMTGSASGNGHWQRYYVAATKHLDIKNVGELGLHVAYVYNKRLDYHLNGPAIGANLRFGIQSDNLAIKALNKLNVIVEYDSRTVNCGFKYSFWKDYINAVVEMTECKHLSGGLVFKVHLK